MSFWCQVKNTRWYEARLTIWDKYMCGNAHMWAAIIWGSKIWYYGVLGQPPSCYEYDYDLPVTQHVVVFEPTHLVHLSIVCYSQILHLIVQLYSITQHIETQSASYSKIKDNIFIVRDNSSIKINKIINLFKLPFLNNLIDMMVLHMLVKLVCICFI